MEVLDGAGWGGGVNISWVGETEPGRHTQVKQGGSQPCVGQDPWEGREKAALQMDCQGQECVDEATATIRPDA